MKKTLIIALLCTMTSNLKAQNTFPFPSSGNVGIGTTTPHTPLEVNGDITLYSTNGSRVLFGYGAGPIYTGQIGSTFGITGSGTVDDFNAFIFGNNPFNIWTNSNKRLTVDGSGNVGIGTTSLSSLLTIGSTTTRGTLNVVGSTADVPAISLSDSRTGGHQFTFYNGVSSFGGLDIYDQTANAYRFNINASGNVGIGTTSPGALLEVGSATTRGTGNIVSGNGQAPVLSLTDLNTGGHQYALYSGSSAAGSFDIADITAAVSRITILGNGNMGIGTTSPTAILHVSSANLPYTGLGQAIIASSGTTAVDNGGQLSFVGNYYSGAPAAYANFANIAGRKENITDNNDAGYLQFSTKTSGVVNLVEQMRITSSGNMGIGTTTPDAKLAVNGTIHSKQVVIDLIGWPDYVFKPIYHLTPLSEVKTYIDLNHHLPDMPSEKEVADKGLNLGEMNKLLARKVEELTLYLIIKDKEVKALEERLNKLENNKTEQQ